jgi:two-component system sensor histidine kinase/response regulator
LRRYVGQCDLHVQALSRRCDDQAQQLRLIGNEYQVILQNRLVGVVQLDQRKIIACNRRFEEIFGYAVGEMLGKSTEMLYHCADVFATVDERSDAILSLGGWHSEDIQLCRRNGDVFWAAMNGRLIDPERPEQGSLWVVADISELSRAEAEVHKLLRAVEQSPVSIVITDCDGNIDYVNPRFTRVTGYTLAEAIGQNPRILKSGETPPETYSELWETVLAGRDWRGILRNRRKSGELFWEEASISPIIDAQGKITHILAVKEDISERKRIEEELEEHQRNLEELVRQRTWDLFTALETAKVAEKTKDAFLANISHELRTPLNAIIGLSDLALRGHLEPKIHDTLAKISDSGQMLLAIVNDLLDLTKIAAGEMNFERIPFSLQKIARRVASVMAERIAAKGLIFALELDADLPAVLIGDPLRIEQILLNLLSNAIKFTEAGHVTLRIALEGRQDDKLRLRFEIEDSGIGMTPAELERIFKPFAQADVSITRLYGGTGLGLAICKRLAEAMAGSIEVSSRPGQGTTFTVHLLACPGEAGELPAAADEPAALTESMVAYAGARLLVVDDQQINREVLCEVLGTQNIRPILAENGRQAVNLLREAGPDGFDLVLMDIQMPVMDGLTATGEIRALPGFGALPIIAMTAHTMDHEKATYLAAGMNDHIGKPFNIPGFFAMLAKWLQASAAVAGLPGTEDEH